MRTKSTRYLLPAVWAVMVACQPRGHLTAEVTDWKIVNPRSAEVDVRFDESAPAYGCEVDALSRDGRSIGYVIAKPEDEETGTFLMRLDRGTTDEIDEVAVVDCGS